MGAAEYKYVVLSLIFLKYISDSFEEHHAKLTDDEGDICRPLVEGGPRKERRNLQFAAEFAWPHRDAVDAAQRKAFGLQPDRPLV